MSATLLSGMLLLVAEAALRFEGSVGAGAGYDTNLTLVPSGDPASDSLVAAGWAGLGVGASPLDSAYLYAGARYDGAMYPSATDLGSNAASLEFLWVQDLGDHFAVIVAPSATWSWYRDAARSGPGVSARLTLRVKPWPSLALRAGYAYSQRWANDDAYSIRGHRLLGSAEVRVARGVYFALGYAHAIIDQTFYAPAPTPAATTTAFAQRRSTRATESGSGPGGSGSPTGTGGTGASGGSGSSGGSDGAGGSSRSGASTHRGTGVFADLVPYLATAHENTLLASVEIALWEGLYLFASYSYTWGSSEQESYTTQSAFGGLGYRF